LAGWADLPDCESNDSRLVRDKMLPVRSLHK